MPLTRLLLVFVLPLYVADQVSKWWIVLTFPEPPPGYTSVPEMITVVEGFFNIVRVHNQGVAFGFGNGTLWAPPVFLLVQVVALVAIIVLYRRGVFATPLLRVAAGLLLTGIVGNMTDRLLQGFFLEAWNGAGFWTRLSKGYVVDFLDFTLPLVNYRWPAFNVADSCICVAAFFLILSTFREEQVSKEASGGEETGSGEGIGDVRESAD